MLTLIYSAAVLGFRSYPRYKTFIVVQNLKASITATVEYMRCWRFVAYYIVQFSNFKPGMRSNSFLLLVTKVRLRLLAWEAINVSKGPIGEPFFYKSALIFPYSIVAA